MAIFLINPRLTNPQIQPGRDLLASSPPPAEIAAILRNSCYDCHSDETKWPWYSHVALVSWWLVEHVEDGRKRLNLSKWSHDDPKRSARRWRSMGDAVNDGDMPLPSYTWAHPKSRLTDQQRQVFAKYAEDEADRIIESMGDAR